MEHSEFRRTPATRYLNELLVTNDAATQRSRSEGRMGGGVCSASVSAGELVPCRQRLRAHNAGADVAVVPIGAKEKGSNVKKE